MAIENTSRLKRVGCCEGLLFDDCMASGSGSGCGAAGFRLRGGALVTGRTLFPVGPGIDNLCPLSHNFESLGGQNAFVFLVSHLFAPVEVSPKIPVRKKLPLEVRN